jgi:type II secretory pathway component PulF
LAAGATSVCIVAGGWLGYFVAWPIVMALWARAAINFRATQKRNLLGALAIAIDNNMPLGPVALAFAEEQQGSFAGRARALGDALSRGVALEKAWPESSQALPPEMPMAAALGRESGDLAAALDATTYANVFDRSWLQPAISRMLYLLALLMVFNVTVLFMQAKITPSYVRIFDDFDARLPNPTLAAVSQLPRPDVRWQAPNPLLWLPESATDWLAFNTPASFLTVAFQLGWATFMNVVSMFVLSLFLLYVWLQWRGTLMPRMPGLRKIINWMDMGPVLRGLALAAARQRPMLGVLLAMARLHPKRTVRMRLNRVVRDLDNGIPWYDGLVRQKLVDRNDTVLLAAAGTSGNLAWALTETAAAFERRATYRLQLLSQTVAPMLVLPFGLLTAFVAVAYFAPLSELVIYLSARA